MTLQYVLPDFSRNRHGYVRGHPTPSIPFEVKSGADSNSTDNLEIDQELATVPTMTMQPGCVMGHGDERSTATLEERAASEFDQILYMSNERFTVPELLFNPGDIGVPLSTVRGPHIIQASFLLHTLGLAQSGLPQTIAHSIASLPPDLQGMFWVNIGLIGGNAKFPGFSERLYVVMPVSSTHLHFSQLMDRRRDLRALAPVEYDVKTYESNE